MQRQQIPHQIYKDNNGVEHVRVSRHIASSSSRRCVGVSLGSKNQGQEKGVAAPEQRMLARLGRCHVGGHNTSFVCRC